MFEGVAVFLFGFLVGARVATVYWSENKGKKINEDERRDDEETNF